MDFLIEFFLDTLGPKITVGLLVAIGVVLGIVLSPGWLLAGSVLLVVVAMLCLLLGEFGPLGTSAGLGVAYFVGCGLFFLLVPAWIAFILF